MSKKRSKSGAGSAGIQRWEQALLSTPFVEEDKWNASITFVVGNQIDDFENINILAQTILSGVRRLYSVITAEDLYNQVRDLGNPKAKKTKDIPNNYEICEPCKQYLDNEEDIPLPLLAKLIKFKLLDIKEKDRKRREAEKKAATEKDKGGKGGAKDKKERSKSPAKGKGGKKTPEPPSAKEGSKLRKRGEEDNDNKYIDDEPDDGPQHYIFISGFHQPHFLTYLADININVDCIIKMSSENYSRYEVKVEETDQPVEGAEAVEPVEKDEKTIALEEEARRKKVKSTKELQQFWKDVLLIMQNSPAQSHLHNVARLEYVVRDAVILENMDAEPEKKTEYGLALFEDTACMVYDMLDAKRQWRNYLQHLKLIKVPVMPGSAQAQAQDCQSQPSVTPAVPPATDRSKPDTLSAAETDSKPAETVDMRYYNDLMNAVPMESNSVPLIMHCMLEQVVASETGTEPPSETPRAARSDGLEDKLAAHVSALAFKLALSEQEREVLSQDFDPPRPKEAPRKQPLLINYHDDVTRRLGHLKPVDGMDPLKAELAMQGYLPVSDLRHYPTPAAKVSKERSARLQELIALIATGELTQPEIEHAFRQFTFESTNLTSVDEEGNVVPRSTGPKSIQRDIPYDDPYPFYKGMMPPEEAEPVEKAASQTSASPALSESPSPSDRSASPGADSLHLGADAATLVTRSSSPSSRKSSGKKRGRSGRKGSPGSKGRGRASPAPPPADPEPPKPEESSSRPGTPGILKRSDSAGSKRPGSAHSVHFEKDGDDAAAAVAEPSEEELHPPMADVQSESWTQVNDVQKRNLDQWCFAEHMEPAVLIQVLKEAEYQLPYLDTYYHKRDHSLLLVMHNPYGENLRSTVTWETNLHSNVGFRNYLEQVAASIEEWTLEQEAKYQATMLAAEVEKISKDADDAAAASSRPASGKKGRAKSPKKSPSRAKSSSSRPSSAERSPRDPYVRQGSLKAWKAEQDAIKAEEDEKEREKNAKRAKSATKKGAKEEEKEDKKGPKRTGSRNSAKSRASKEELVPVDLPKDDGDTDPEPFWPFLGYDMGDNLLHVSGSINTMFPADGGQIRTEKVQYKQGTTAVKSTVVKDGHTFSVHVLDPKDPGAEEEVEEEEELPPKTAENTEEDGKEKAEMEKQEKEETAGTPPKTPNMGLPEPKKPCVGRFGSFSCQLNDGISLALSTYAAGGEPSDGKKYEPIPYIAPPPRSPSPGPKDSSPSKGKKAAAKAQSTPEPPQQTDELAESVFEEPVKHGPVDDEVKVPEQSFQPLTVSCPDGLTITYMLESQFGIMPEAPEKRKLLVRQNYPNKTRGAQACEAARAAAMQEVSRVINADGSVVKTRIDGTVQVLFANGTVSDYLTTCPVVTPSRAVSPSQRTGSAKSDRDTPSKKGGKSRKSAKKAAETIEADAVEDEAADRGCWITTTPEGDKICSMRDGTNIPMKACMLTAATDPYTRQVMHTREDHVVRVEHPDGTIVVEHADGTRVTTFTQTIQVPSADENEEEEEEDPEEAPREEVVRIIQVEAPGYATVKFDSASSECSTDVGNGSVIHTFPEGRYDVYHSDGGYLHIEGDGSSMYYPRPNNDLEMFNPGQQLQYSFRHFGEVIVETVDNEGSVFNVSSTGDSVVMTTKGDIAMMDEEEEGGEEQEEQMEGEVTIKRKQVVEYKQHAPRLFVIHPDGSGTELLRYHDVAEYVSQAEDDPTTAILMDPLPDFPGVIGITILKPYLRSISQQWLKPYSVDTIVPSGLVSRDLRTLPASENRTDGPKFGTNVGQGLAVGSRLQDTGIPDRLTCPQALEVRQILQYKPISEDLRETLWHGLQKYGDTVRTRLANSQDLLVHDPRSEEEKQLAASLRMMTREKTKIDGDVKGLYEKATAPAVPSPPPTPQPKRTKADWERDQREIADEEANKRALRGNHVPPYFDSELGKAFLLTQAPDMTALAKQLAQDPRRDGSRAVRASETSPPEGQQRQQQQPQPPAQTTPTAVPPSEGSSGSYMSPPLVISTQVSSSSTNNNNAPAINGVTTPSALRPGNPTPAHAQGKGSPAPLRPNNPTPAHATKVTDRPGAPTPKEAGSNSRLMRGCSETSPQGCIQERPYEEQQHSGGENGRGIVPSADSDIVLTRSLAVNVKGEPREQLVQPPGYLYGGRPNAQPNNRYSQIEEPVRRQVKTSSIAGATMEGYDVLRRMRGLELLPERCDMGVLREGNTYCFTVFLKNTGQDSCRYKVKQPPPSTGVKVIYKPGPIAAGMKGELNIEIYAIAVGVQGGRGVGTISHNMEITTETDIIHLPITATILTAHEYDHRGDESPKGGKASGVKMVTSKPPAGIGIIRPRKDPNVIATRQTHGASGSQ